MHQSVIVLIGILVVLLPFGTTPNISNAHAIADFDNDKDRKQQVSVSSLKCNNINVNVNGLELDVFQPFLGGEVAATAAEDGETYANSVANNGGSNSGYQINDFRFICINNNNNTVVAANETTILEPETCEDCFTTILTDEELDDLISGTVLFNTLEELCNFIDTNFENESQRLFISQYLFDAADDVGISTDKINSILDCLEEIYDVEFPRP